MRKRFSAVLILLSICIVIVGAHSTTVKERDSGKLVAVDKAVSASHFDVAFINDWVEPEVQSNHLMHIESILITAGGYAPMTERKARAPTIDKTNLSPLPRDKPYQA